MTDPWNGLTVHSWTVLQGDTWLVVCRDTRDGLVLSATGTVSEASEIGYPHWAWLRLETAFVWQCLKRRHLGVSDGAFPDHGVDVLSRWGSGVYHPQGVYSLAARNRGRSWCASVAPGGQYGPQPRMVSYYPESGLLECAICGHIAKVVAGDETGAHTRCPLCGSGGSDLVVRHSPLRY